MCESYTMTDIAKKPETNDLVRPNIHHSFSKEWSYKKVKKSLLNVTIVTMSNQLLRYF